MGNKRVVVGLLVMITESFARIHPRLSDKR
jgi:hypothetical protein